MMDLIKQVSDRYGCMEESANAALSKSPALLELLTAAAALPPQKRRVTTMEIFRQFDDRKKTEVPFFMVVGMEDEGRAR